MSAGEAPGRGSALLSWAGLLLGGLYLLNPFAGIFEFLPDNLPLVGNLDEGGAMALILFCARNLTERRRALRSRTASGTSSAPPVHTKEAAHGTRTSEVQRPDPRPQAHPQDRDELGPGPRQAPGPLNPGR